MGRHRLFNDEQFIKVLKVTNNAAKTATALKCSVASVYLHAERLEIPIQRAKRANPATVYRIAQDYRGPMSLTDLGRKHSYSVSAVRTMLQRYINQVWNDPSSEMFHYAVPEQMIEIKLAHAIADDATLLDNPDELAKVTDIDKRRCARYLDRSFERIQSRPTIRKRPVVRGRRAQRVA